MASPVEYWVWLGLAYGSGSGKTDALIEHFPNIEELYRSGAYRDVARVPKAEGERLSAVMLDDAKRIVEQMAAKGVAILTPDDPRYPERLRQIYAKPCVLYVEGELGDVDHELEIGMVGTRRCTEYGRRAADKIASELARAGAVVVSGLATGIDSVCHSAAVQQGCRTIAVMGCGIDRTYPPQNKALREQIARGGAVLTEYAPGSPPAAQHFPVRNRIISGLSLGIVVVEASLRSGSLITANLAIEQGRDVFAVPGGIFDVGSQGILHLLRQGAAAPVSCSADVLEGYRWRFETLPRAEQESPQKEKPEPQGLSQEALEVWRALDDSPLQLEDISGRLEKPAQQVLTAMTELEIMGVVYAMSGKRYRRA